MSEPRLVDLSDADFDALIAGHIERTARGEGELPVDTFVDLLLTRRQASAAAPVTLDIDVQGDQVRITAENLDSDVQVQGNEILIGGRRLVLRLVQQPAA
jgi:hypothetical protein